MNFLEGLGLGGVFGYGQQSLFIPQPMSGNYPIYTNYVCQHQNCPICRKELEEQTNRYHEEQNIIALKKELYNERCKEYMIAFKEKIKLLRRYI